MICERCMVVMKSGTLYQQYNGKNIARRYDECPKCKARKYNNQPNLQETFTQKTRNKSL